MNSCNTSDGAVAPVDRKERLMSLAEIVARRLAAKYPWISFDDLKSYSYLGLLYADTIYDESRGLPYRDFVIIKGAYIAVDEMRSARVLSRGDLVTSIKIDRGNDTDCTDPFSDKANQEFESREFCHHLLSDLGESELRLLEMKYKERMTYSEIASVLGISESAVCLRHKKLIAILRRKASLAAA